MILEVKNLSFSYKGEERKVLDNLSFSLSEGEYLAIIGHNGSGKSTLGKVLAGINGGFDGEISIFNKELNSSNINFIRQKMGFVFQNPDNQFVGSSVRDDIAFGLENRALPQKEMDPLINFYAEKVGMSDYLDRAPENLSGGQKQRVAIAGVLATSPELIIFDEATSMLDPRAKKEILSLISSLRKENPHLTILSITHDLEEASKSDKVLVLNEGKEAFFGKPEEVFSNYEKLKEMGLDLPFFEQLKETLISLDVPLSDDIKDLDSLREFLCR